jgi:hypothetical protein
MNNPCRWHCMTVGLRRIIVLCNLIYICRKGWNYMVLVFTQCFWSCVNAPTLILITELEYVCTRIICLKVLRSTQKTMHIFYLLASITWYTCLPGNFSARGGGGGETSYILVYTDVPLEWVLFLTSQIYQWDAIFINLLYQWVDDLACHYINGW